MEKVQWNSINKKQNWLQPLKAEKSSQLPALNFVKEISETYSAISFIVLHVIPSLIETN